MFTIKYENSEVCLRDFTKQAIDAAARELAEKMHAELVADPAFSYMAGTIENCIPTARGYIVRTLQSNYPDVGWSLYPLCAATLSARYSEIAGGLEIG